MTNPIEKKLKKIITSELSKSSIQTRADLDCFKRRIAKKYGLTILKNSELLKIYHETTAKKREGFNSSPLLEILLRKRPVRSLSGIVNVSVLTKPYPCPGKCIFCPQEKNVPKSYLKNEPAVQRAIVNKFNPYQQVIMRLRALKETGHPTDKIEIRIIGGTWSYYPKTYQRWFITECFRACNNFNKRIKNQESRIGACGEAYRDHLYRSFQRGGLCKLCKLQQKNEKAKCRAVGIAVETRPDFINPSEIKQMRELGITKVELGVQTLYDDILSQNQRGHNVDATITATRLLKNAGFKISYQIMPDLYGSNLKKDAAMFCELFENPDFKPDYLKIYPLALIKNTALHRLYQAKKYKPYTRKELLRLLIEIKKHIPYWCRVERIIRDIPSTDIIEGGSKVLNLREIVQKEMQKRGLRCRCVRCREVKKNYNPKERIKLFREDYEASNSKEVFLSFENQSRSKIYALLRLRLPVLALKLKHSHYSRPPHLRPNSKN
ncbi:tRNA uridine(34) 5-carboxymethylaminomethyl modification radical SAM/GNAT enzyme Elp3 [bacterium (Candidatus Gribaldobacteria) CG08_land_8_20_14_0_20_39_15]|uniref:tRNA uridine(34) 5-carboxymethylaminomethyl modification radical SAM/GNAT enzyme Elp3 n=1 Tax=bacterium (Candidatus Gribaldobacteria) CG08_land_8_20_14_0_20_39_15 TaxID=2014273 RepID=A0A2M6XTZ8_9BACT|nr:MAG: tRNA uridine(34) 5-carboxymethylaminomethyl modification radical SAM/GNAT enzyme Elp3 [bacterium (Candidatus Gribaldobacteria) CG08_land_8_20_14_0_20_39_15]